MIKKILPIHLLAAIIFVSSCTGFLTRDTYDLIGSNEFWQSETDLELYSNGLIQNMIPAVSTITRYGDGKSDMFAQYISDELVRQDSNVSADNQDGWSESDWSDLRRVNYMLDNMYKCKGNVPDEIYRHYEGVARFWRAWFYYGKVRTFGGVPWYSSVISANDNEALTRPRDSREVVMDNILADLNFASENCSSDSRFVTGSTVISKWTALAFKSRVCLYEGTYRKYHSVDPSTGIAWDNAKYNADNKFLKEAVKASLELMTDGPYELLTGNPKTYYRTLFVSEKLQTKEVIFGREFSKDLSTFHDATWKFFSPTYGEKYSMVKNFVNTYLLTDGTPFTDKPGYKSIPFTEEFKSRDARLSQTVITPEWKMTIDGVYRLYSPNWLITRTGYQPIKWCLAENSNGMFSSSRAWNSLPIIRYAEVLLNYAEAKAELGEMDEAVWNRTIAPLRERAGVKSIVPTQVDQYMRDYFMDNEGTLDKWILEIRRERGTELCMEMGLRWDDLMRWKKGELLSSDNRPWTGIWVGNTSYSYSYTGLTDDKGNKIIDFQILPGSETEHSINVVNTGENQSFSINADGNLVYEYKRIWTEQKYLRPIPTSALLRNPALEQNILWK